MSKYLSLFAAMGLLLLATQGAVAAEFGTAAEARNLLERAVVEIKADPRAAIAKFNSSEGGFRDRDLYVFCINADNGITSSHASAAQIGIDVRTLKDAAGKPFGEEIFASGREGQFGTVSYLWPRPGSQTPVAKESYVTRVGGQICGVGYYK